MCGIAGIWHLTNIDPNDELVIKKMTDSISHRGPDGEGFWFSDNHLLHLGHRRLSIIDLTDGGSQPMIFDDKYVIVFNGEIYNYIELKDELIKIGYTFKSKSDTEVILASYHEWGTDCLKRFDGMFAFALYNIEQKELFCARDRFGEKPFYYSFYNGSFYFASEMKALWAAGVPRVPKYSLYYNYFVHDLVDNPFDSTHTFFEDIYKLQLSHYFVMKGDKNFKQKKYWELNTNSNHHLDINEASDKLMSMLETSLKRRLRSDVPLGTSLSGGLDSSTIVALISKNTQNNHTFSARFKDFNKDEGKYIDLVKKKFSTNHHDIFVDADDFIDGLDKLIYHQEEPFQTGSIFAQYCVYRESRKNKIPVMLDGQGADELLGGYDKDLIFYLRERIQNKNNPKKFIEQVKLNHGINLSPTTKEVLRHHYPGLYKGLSKLRKIFSNSVPSGVQKGFYLQYGSQKSPFFDPEDLKTVLQFQLSGQGLEKLLRFADRNSMAHSVEVRLPFLSHELVEFVMSLNSHLFLHNGWSKAILRNGVKDILPSEIVYRKDKIGFEAPHKEWIKEKKVNEMIGDFKSKLINDRIISENYTEHWKILIGSKVLYGM